MKDSLKSALNSSIVILKLIIPIYILAELLFYYNTLSYFSFLIEPFTSILDLPKEASLAIISGMFLNLYGAIAFAAPIGLSPKEWTILAVFLGVCHSLIVESAIMKHLGISLKFSYTFRILTGFFLGYLTTFIPKSYFQNSVETASFAKREYESLLDLLQTSFIDATTLSIKIIILISLIIFIMDFIKNSAFIKNSEKNISKPFSLLVGVFLGITYGAGILIKEAKSGTLTKKEIFFIASFLSICHAIIEDTLLFVIFGADFTAVVVIRTVFAFVFAYVFTFLYFRRAIA